MNVGTSASRAPGPVSSAGIRRATAASMKAASSNVQERVRRPLTQDLLRALATRCNDRGRSRGAGALEERTTRDRMPHGGDLPPSGVPLPIGRGGPYDIQSAPFTPTAAHVT